MTTIAAQRVTQRGNKHNPDLTKEAKADASHVRNVPTPSRIKCIGCKIVKGPDSFSKNKISELTAQIQRSRGNFNPVVQVHIPCHKCTGGQVVELTCYNCDKTKGLDGFPKTARRTPDRAMCWKCSQEKNQYEPGGGESDSSNSGHDQSDDDDYTDDSDEDSLSGGVRGVTLSGTGSNATYPGGPPSTSASGGGVEVRSISTSTAQSAVRRFTGSTSGNRKFAKVPAGPKPKIEPRDDGPNDEEIPSDDGDEEGTIYTLD